ncbi:MULTISPECIES: hypothetical protein [Bacteroidales]|jgi:hypothetical protein|uniref:Uncharacterized protein n=1 Tax=Muribaculum gordoncarteri TaxID=2530390 RepID=A0A4P7VBH0_9BACT|nr:MULTISPECIES: hypothetical protein [Bacteroidales]QCD34743.1 hypothetical protein E7746_02050 [Muribaculum gordoncarteri]
MWWYIRVIPVWLALDFLNWFCGLPYRHKAFIGGNHDDCLYRANIGGLDDNGITCVVPALKLTE